MTPLQTPPSSSAVAPVAPPALKPQNHWVMDESEDDIGDIPSVSFPLLMPRRNNAMARPLGAAAAPSASQQPLPAPSLQPQSCGFLKFPALKRENNSQDSQPPMTISQPIPIRPSDHFRGRSPSLQLIMDNELLNDAEKSEAAAANQVHRPPLRNQPLRSGAETPSHLARRGVEERTYLESQLRAEEQMRRKHRMENQERKAREGIVIEDDENDTHNDEISALMEKFSEFQLNNEEILHESCFRHWAPARNMKFSRDGSTAPSPPIILQKAFKRSVSAVIADSRGQEDEDACVLFFPDGLPLVDECNEGMPSVTSQASLENCNSFDLDSKCALSPHTYDVTEGSTPFGTVSCQSTPNSVQCQPVLLGGEVENGGSFNKKVMLRPKMKVRPKTPAKLKNTVQNCRGEEDEAVPDQIDCYYKLFEHEYKATGFAAIPDLELSQESLEEQGYRQDEEGSMKAVPNRSFQRLDSEATIVRKNGAASDDLYSSETFESIQSCMLDNDQGWNYSSPEPIRRPQFTTLNEIPPPPRCMTETTPIEPFQLELKEPLSESNYCTPDHSNFPMRKQLHVRPSGVLDPLPELFLPNLNKKLQSASLQNDLSTFEGESRAEK